MKIHWTLAIMVAVLLAAILAGCGRSASVIQQGVLWSVEWADAGGKTHGLTRANVALAVPGGTGSWNVDMYGVLYSTHLEIRYPKQKDLGPQIIPFERIVSIQFGDGGKRTVE